MEIVIDKHQPLRVFIGWDSQQVPAYEVARHSFLRHTSYDVTVEPLVLSKLQQSGLYYRTEDPLASTEFTYSRFLAPHLARYQGWALFFDCDFLWLGDFRDVFSTIDGSAAVYCVKHDYTPRETTKMDGKAQSNYPRKNWSSLMLFNCSHPSVSRLTPSLVNEATGAFLHQMKWTSDDNIGTLTENWNWLEGWSDKNIIPKAVHFTRGGPWMDNWSHVEYADQWFEELRRMRNSCLVSQTSNLGQ